MSELHRVTHIPGLCGGRPTIRGLRIRVRDVLDLLAAGATRQEILDDYPNLEDADITAALQDVSRKFDHSVLLESNANLSYRWDMAENLLRQLDKTKIGERLALIRRIVDMTQEDFAINAGLTRTQYNQCETGARMPSVEAATYLCMAYDLTLDFIFLGNPSGLRLRTVDAIKALSTVRDESRRSDTSS